MENKTTERGPPPIRAKPRAAFHSRPLVEGAAHETATRHAAAASQAPSLATSPSESPEGHSRTMNIAASGA
jgi:hypothetical protein